MTCGLLLGPLATAAAQTGVPPAGRVVDRADVLSPTTEAALEAALEAHQDSTSNQVAVLTLPSLEGDDLERYATRVARAWGLGREGRDNGVLVLVVLDDRAVRVEVGGGLEGALTDATAGSIIRAEMVPRFREGDVDGGVLAGVGAVLEAVEGEYVLADDGRSWLARLVLEGSTWDRFLIFVGFGLFFPFFILCAVWVSEPMRVLDATALCLILSVLSVIGFYVWFVEGWVVTWSFVVVPLLFVLVDRLADFHPTNGRSRRRWRKLKRLYRKARERGDAQVEIDGKMVDVPPAPAPRASSPSSYRSRRSSGGGWFDGGGGGGSRSSVGGFGGGWFGGGGASGSW